VTEKKSLRPHGAYAPNLVSFIQLRTPRQTSTSAEYGGGRDPRHTAPPPIQAKRAKNTSGRPIMEDVRKILTILPLLVMGAFPTLAENGSLESVYDCFIDRFADGNPAWKTDIILGADLNTPPRLPYRLHYDDSLGYYIYRPKRWNELNHYERFALENDPRLPDFIRENSALLRKGQFDASAERAKETGAGDDGVGARTQKTEPASSELQAQGFLIEEGENRYGYRFEPADLLNSKPLRLVEVHR